MPFPCTGKYGDVALELYLTQLNAVDGMKTLLEHMDKNFKEENADSAYEFYEEFSGIIKKEN